MKAIFLDRDGVICKNRTDHVKSWDEFRFLPGAKEALAQLSQLDLPVIVVTNQAAINRGLVSAKMVEEIHHRMVDEVTAAGGRIDRVFYCPHRPDEDCLCRKPRPGLLLQAAKEMGVQLAGSYMVGDAATDLLAGSRTGAETFLVLTGRGLRQVIPSFQVMSHPFRIMRELSDAVAHIVDAEYSRLPLGIGQSAALSQLSGLLPNAEKLPIS
jgi:D-glycero-D-manno-heptose 1,7-bisphosphate phosphatase